DPLTGELAPLLNPRMQRWEDHFTWSHDGTRIIGQTPTGRATVQALRMNDELIIKARERWVKGGWWPPAGGQKRSGNGLLYCARPGPGPPPSARSRLLPSAQAPISA